MISKNKQEYEIEMHFDPQVIRMGDSTLPNNRSFFIVRDSTMPFGERFTCEFHEYKSLKAVESSIKKLKKFAAELKSYNFEPITVVIQNQGKIYAGSVMCSDYSMEKEKSK
jgi:hypothetical protein